MNFSGFKDKILYTRFKQKDKDAFIKAYDLYADHIYRFVFFKVNNKEEAEDITSQVFLKSWDYIQNNNLTDFKTLKSLFYKVSRNLVIDHYRKKSTRQSIVREEDISEFDIVDHKQDMAENFASQHDYELVRQKLFELKDEYREVIVLRFLNELSIAEIADAMGKNKGNIRILIFRALKALRELSDTNTNK